MSRQPHLGLSASEPTIYFPPITTIEKRKKQKTTNKKKMNKQK
jgi:hypothetical protein